MISRIQVKNYRSLKYIDISLKEFNVFIGPNASGKSTLLEAINFVGTIVSKDFETVVENIDDFNSITWKGLGGSICFALEAAIPDTMRTGNYDTVRYEIEIGNGESSGIEIINETAMFIDCSKLPTQVKEDSYFPHFQEIETPIFLQTGKKDINKHTKRLLSKVRGGNDNYYPETSEKVSGKGKGGYFPSYKLGARRSALRELPADESKFPVLIWFRELLSTNLQMVFLDSVALRKASPPSKRNGFHTDGGNLPWLVHSLKSNNERLYHQWIQHVKSALPDIVSIVSIEREDDKHRYLKVNYSGDISVPSWLLSDGTLRLLALTLMAYIPEMNGIFLIEEPENGIHPKAVESIIQSLSSIYDSQVVLATHSPVILNLVQAYDVFCFAKDTGASVVVRGDLHPQLTDWKGTPNLGSLLAGGVLG